VECAQCKSLRSKEPNGRVHRVDLALVLWVR
jgi:hypothetical protein